MQATCVSIIVLLGVTLVVPHQSFLHPDAGLNVLELVEKHGYPLERHTVQSIDGYLVEIHRIPHGIGNNASTRGPVLFMHGLTSSSVDWINTGPEKSLAYKLTELGYDIWLCNYRGNTWGRKHVTLDPDVDKAEFWNFSFQEMASYDLPAMIDHILKTNGADKLFYVGHSQGTTIFFAMAAENPEYNNKIRLMTALAPIVFIRNNPNPFLHIVAQFEENLEHIYDTIGLYEFFPHSKLNEILSKEVCADKAPLQEFCKNIYFLTVGFDSEQFNASLLSVITANLPAGTSARQFLHLSQIVKHGHFRKYDFHDGAKNIEAYGQPIPPDYNLSQITTPVSLNYGQNDLVVAIKDVNILKSYLPNVVVDNKIAYKKFNHGDFLWATDVFDLLYNDVIDTIEKY